jgi:hypothetical protein
MLLNRSALALAVCLFSAPVMADELEPLVPADIDALTISEIDAALPTVEVMDISEPTVVEVSVPHHTRALPIVLQSLWAACAFYALLVFGAAFVRGLGRRTILAQEI